MLRHCNSPSMPLSPMQKIVEIIEQEIGTCNREIRKASDSILVAEERRVNYGDQKLVLGARLEILKKE